MEDVTLDQIIALYQKQVGATVGELGIVGDFDADAALAQLRDILKDWKSDVAVKRIERVAPAEVTGAKEDILTPDKANAVYLAGLAFRLKETDDDYPALRLGNFILGGGTLSSRLGNRIRQKEGLSYGVTSALNASTRDPSATFIVNATTNPANIDRVDKCVAEELKAFLADGPSKEELDDAKKAYLESQKVSRTTDGALAGQIVSNLQLGRKFAHTSDMEKKIAALTPEEVKAAFAKYVDPKKLVIIRAGDFKK
jgi:zinc protease